MKFIRGRENQIINLEFVRVIDIHEVGGKQEVQADMGEYSIELASFEHVAHAKAYLDKLWQDAFDGRCDNLGNLLEPQSQLAV